MKKRKLRKRGRAAIIVFVTIIVTVAVILFNVNSNAKESVRVYPPIVLKEYVPEQPAESLTIIENEPPPIEMQPITIKADIKEPEKLAANTTPNWGKYTPDEYYLLATVIYYEASPNATLQAACAVGWVARNRSESATWGYQSIEKTIYRAGQFSVVNNGNFASMIKKIKTLNTTRAKTARRAAKYVMQGREKYRIPKNVQYFHGDQDKRSWGSHEFYKEIGGNAFFYA